MKIKAPGSKSITQRALICASLADGVTRIKNPLICEDTELLINALRTLGIEIMLEYDEFVVFGNRGIFKNLGKKRIYMGNNGTGLRFLITLANFYPEEVIIYGNNRMNSRPVDELIEALREAGAEIEYIEKRGFPPVKIGNFNNRPKSEISIEATKSSQFVSSLLLSGVLFENGLKLNVNRNIPSQPYVDMTLNVMKEFGVEVKRGEDFFIIPNRIYRAVNFTVEGDFSSSSYFFVVPFFLEKPITVENLNYISSTQPDKEFLDILIEMGAKVKFNDNSVTIFPSNLHPVEVDMRKTPDLVPTFAVLSSIVNGVTLIKNIEHLRYKESDRISAIAVNLKKFGIDVESGKDFLKIAGKDKAQIIKLNKDTIKIETFDDHRIAMSFALFKLLGLKLEFDNRDCVNKSFPDFWEKFKKIVDK